MIKKLITIILLIAILNIANAQTQPLSLLSFKPNTNGISLGFTNISFDKDSIDYGFKLSSSLLGKDSLQLGVNQFQSSTTYGMSRSLAYNSNNFKAGYRWFNQNDSKGNEWSFGTTTKMLSFSASRNNSSNKKTGTTALSTSQKFTITPYKNLSFSNNRSNNIDTSTKTSLSTIEDIFSFTPYKGYGYSFQKNTSTNATTNTVSNLFYQNILIEPLSWAKYSQNLSETSTVTNNNVIALQNTKTTMGLLKPFKGFNISYNQNFNNTKAPNTPITSNNNESFIVNWAMSPLMNLSYDSQSRNISTGAMTVDAFTRDALAWNWKAGNLSTNFVDETTTTIKNNISTEQEHRLITMAFPTKQFGLGFSDEHTSTTQSGTTTEQDVRSFSFTLPPTQKYQFGFFSSQGRTTVRDSVTTSNYNSLTLSYAPFKGFTSNFAFDRNALNINGNPLIQQHQLINFAYVPFGFTFNMDHRTNTAPRTILNDLFTFKQTLLGMKFNALYSNVDNGAANTIGTLTRLAHLESDRTQPNNFMLERRNTSLTNGSIDDTTTLDVNYIVARRLSMNLNIVEIDRGKTSSSTTETLRWDYIPNKISSVNGMRITNTTTPDSIFTTTNAVAVSNVIANNFQVVGSHSATDKAGSSVATQSNIVIANSKPLHFPLNDSILAFKYNSITAGDNLQTQAVAGIFRGRIGANMLNVSYDNTLDIKGISNIVRVLEIKNQKPGLFMNYGTMYRARNINRGDVIIEQDHNVSFKISPTFNIVGNYTVLPTLPSTFVMARTATTGVKYQLSKKMGLSFDYSNILNPTQKLDVLRFATIVSGNINPNIPVRVGYAYDQNRNGNITGHTLLFDYAHKLTAENTFGLNLSYTLNEGHHRDDVTAHIEWKTKWN